MDGGHRNYRYVRCGTAVPAGWRNAPVRNRVFGMDRQGPAPHENPEPGTADGLCNLLGGCGGYILAVWHEPVRCLNHGLTSIATGGFSTFDMSMGKFDGLI